MNRQLTRENLIVTVVCPDAGQCRWVVQAQRRDTLGMTERVSDLAGYSGATAVADHEHRLAAAGGQPDGFRGAGEPGPLIHGRARTVGYRDRVECAIER